MASFFTYRVLAGNGEWHGWIVFTDNVFWKYSWAHVVISITVAFLYVMQCRLRARRSRASSMVFRPWPLRTEIVPDSLNLWMILCTVDDDNFKLLAIFLWETLLILLHYFSPQHWGNWWFSSHLDLWETLPLWEALFIPNHVANWPNKLQIGPSAVPYMYI